MLILCLLTVILKFQYCEGRTTEYMDDDYDPSKYIFMMYIRVYQSWVLFYLPLHKM